MCGLVGAIGLPEEVVRAMSDYQTHRGPDAAGSWGDASVPIALGHRRLSILDLSATGAQPMTSHSGRYVIAFNGEIYNFRELRNDLEREHRAPAWRGTSDTEVLLACFDAWGVAETLPRLNAMFAFAVWDVREHLLTLARDRFGEKPLYYGRSGSAIVFASELKALRALPGFDAALDLDALSLFLRYSCVPAPFSIYRNVKKLPAGHFLPIDPRGRQLPDPVAFWRPESLPASTRDQDGTEAEWVEQLDEILRDSVRLRMVADVPLGAFLSGGIDSTAIVALMQAQSSRPVRTFTIGNQAAGYDEARHAREVASHLGTDHTELYVSPRDALDVVPQLPTIYDEPFGDSSAIPTFLVSRLARQHVTVSLSGDAGDELFGGYNRHVHGPGLWSRFEKVPLPVRRAAARGIELISPAVWDRLAGATAGVTGRRTIERAGDQMHKIARSLRARTDDEFYESFRVAWPDSGRLVRETTSSEFEVSGRDVPIDDLSERMMFLDTLHYLPGDILVKLDRASMAVSLEARVPFLDPRVADLAWRIPRHHKVLGSQGKIVLRRLVDRYVPRELMDRPKQGFAIPVGHWLRSELREWAEDLLSEDRIRRDGLLNAEPIRRTWEQHLSGSHNWDVRLWTVLVLQAWLRDQQGSVG